MTFKDGATYTGDWSHGKYYMRYIFDLIECMVKDYL